MQKRRIEHVVRITLGDAGIRRIGETGAFPGGIELVLRAVIVDDMFEGGTRDFRVIDRTVVEDGGGVLVGSRR